MQRNSFLGLYALLGASVLCQSAGTAAIDGASHNSRLEQAGKLPAAIPRAETLQQTAQQVFASVPLIFEENRGQAGSQFDYLAHADGYTLMLSKSQAILASHESASSLTMRWVGANRDPQVSGAQKLAATSNYFRGNDRTHWVTGLANYRKVEYRRLYRSIDLTYYGNQRQLEYDLTVAPGGDPRQAELAFDQARSVSVDSSSGDLLVATAGETLRFHQPVAYQYTSDAKKHSIAVAYAVRGNHHVRFHVGRYDRARELVIDPTVVYGTYFGGSAAYPGTVFLGIGTDASGNIYVAGYQDNPSMPTTPGSFHPGCIVNYSNLAPCYDYFIAKFDPTQSGANSLIYSTFIGTSGGVNPSESDFFSNRSFAVDSAGNAYLTGGTDDAAYPTTANAYEAHCYQQPGTTAPSACYREIGILTKLDPTGAILVYSTYFGDPDFPLPYALAVDNSGRAFLAGSNAGGGALPVTNGQPCPINANDSQCVGNFAGAFDTTKSGNASLIWLEYISQTPVGVATDGLGNAYVYGETEVLNPPTYAVPNGYQTVSGGGGSNTLLEKFNISGAVTYGTFYQATTAGDSNMHASGIAADASGRAYLIGYTTVESGNQNLPQMNGLSVAPLPSCCAVPYLAALDTTMSGSASLLYATVILPSTLPANIEVNSYLYSIATDGTGKVAVTAEIIGGIQPTTSSSPLYPVVNPLPNSAPGPQTAVLSLIDTTQSGAAALLISTPIGGSANQPWQVSIDAADNLYVAGTTQYGASPGLSLPLTAGGYQTQNVSGPVYPYVLMISPAAGGAAPQPTVTLAVNPTTITLGQTATLTWSSTNATSCSASGAWSGTQNTSGTANEMPTTTGASAYTLTCTGTGGSANATATLTTNAAPQPTATISVSPTTITVGQSATLTWSSTNASSCMASGAWSGSEALSGTLQVAPTAAATNAYTLTCAGTAAGLSATATAMLTISAAVAANPPPAANPPGGGSGGGGLGLDAVLGLLLLVAIRMQRQRLLFAFKCASGPNSVEPNS